MIFDNSFSKYFNILSILNAIFLSDAFTVDKSKAKRVTITRNSLIVKLSLLD
jgi:hypothetical protein